MIRGNFASLSFEFKPSSTTTTAAATTPTIGRIHCERDDSMTPQGITPSPLQIISQCDRQVKKGLTDKTSSGGLVPPKRINLQSKEDKTPSLLADTATAPATTTTTATSQASGQATSEVPRRRSVNQRRTSVESQLSTMSASITSRGRSRAERRRSSRKSINGLIIEFDVDDQDQVDLYADCEDYVEDLKPSLCRSPSNGSLEELRTRLEALEHDTQTRQFPHHDESGLGDDCMSKKLLEALETSHSSRFSHSSPSTGRSLADIEEENKDDFTASTACDEHDEVASHQQNHQQKRRSTKGSARLSINGLVLEYDWSTDEEDCLSDEEEEGGFDDQ